MSKVVVRSQEPNQARPSDRPDLNLNYDDAEPLS